MKKLFTLTLLFAFNLNADDHVESSGYEPNVAEYYVSSFKDGIDLSKFSVSESVLFFSWVIK